MPQKKLSPTTRQRAITKKLPDLTQILRASLVERYTTCGKPGCKCMHGHKHGPSYIASVTIAPGKTRQVYVRKDDLVLVRRWIANYDAIWRGILALSDINFEMLKDKRAPSHHR